MERWSRTSIALDFLIFKILSLISDSYLWVLLVCLFVCLWGGGVVTSLALLHFILWAPWYNERGVWLLKYEIHNKDPHNKCLGAIDSDGCDSQRLIYFATII